MAIRIRDDRNRDVVLYAPPRRIVSLVPSDTLSLFSLGAGDRVVGRTRYCVEPADRVGEIPIVGGTKDTDVDAVMALEPQLVIANQEENARKPLEELARRGATILVAFPRRVADGIAHLARLARVLGVEREPEVRELMRRGYQVASAEPPPGEPVTAFLPIWMDPLMTLSADTVASDLLRLAGARNVFDDRQRRYPLAADLGNAAPRDPGDRDVRYPRITTDELVARAPDIVLLPDEPHEFTPADAEVFAGLDIPAARTGKIRFADGKDLFWYGARSIEAVPRLRALVAELRLG